MSISLCVEVSAFGICRGFPNTGIFVVTVQKEAAQMWTVYRRYVSFAALGEQLKMVYPEILSVPIIDAQNTALDYMEECRSALSLWLETVLKDELILRTQSMYQFLCADANMPPPYVDIHWRTRVEEPTFNEEEMDMDFMYSKSSTDQNDGKGFDEEDDVEDVDEVDVTHNSVWRINNGTKMDFSQPDQSGSYMNRRAAELNDTEEDTAQGLDIQSIASVQAEYIFDSSDQDDMSVVQESPATFPHILEGQMAVDASPVSNKTKRTINLDSFDIIKVVGKGSFGKVFLVRDKAKKTIHAMKVLKKDYIIKKNQVEHTKTERNVLGYVRHPYIVGLRMAFQTSDKLFFVLDYCNGGELFFHLGNAGRFPEDRTRFYAAQITLALEYVHSLGIVYRDLKPENVLLDSKGNIRLTDFGLSKEGVKHHATGATSFCGTPEYIAPEVLLRQGHGRAVDWWSLGALTFEMLVSLPPFYSRSRETMFENIMKAELCFPPYVSNLAKALLRHLLIRDPANRLGSGENDAEEIKVHPFFKPIDWAMMATGNVTPPWTPPVSGSLDVSQFDPEFTSMIPVVSPDMRDTYFGTFDGFTFEAKDGAKLMANGMGKTGSYQSSSSLRAKSFTASQPPRPINSNTLKTKK